jgi:hypothetical protein
MNITRKTWLRSLSAILLAFFSTAAQQQENKSPELAVLVETGQQSGFEIPAFDGGGGSTSGFGLIKSSKVVLEKSAVRELNFRINREGEVVIIHLSVKLANEKEVPVGTYRLSLNEATTAQELSNVGVEPVSLRVVNAKPTFVEASPPIQPLLENRTRAVEVVTFYREPSAPNEFRLTLRNISTKGIMVVDLFMPSPDGNGGGGLRALGDRDHLVMLPGNTSEQMVSISRGGRTMPYGYVPDPPTQQRLIIRTVLFDDGTYDGLVEPAAEISADRSGVNLQRKRILTLLQQAAKAEDGKLQLTLDEFKEEVYALSDIPETEVVRELVRQFPTIGEKSLEQSVRNGVNDGKRELLHYINEFENNLKQQHPNLTFVQWLTQMQSEYGKKIERF